MTKNTGYLTEEQFRDSMGILGLDSVQFLSDRIFNIMADINGKVSIKETVNCIFLASYFCWMNRFISRVSSYI